MNRKTLCGVAVGALVALGCGEASKEDRIQQPALIYSCKAGGLQPPAKLIIPGSGGVSGRWMVVLNNDVASLHTVAVDLASRYGGQVLEEWTSINAFLMGIDDSRAPALSEDSTVCFVEQDQVVSVN